jgi:hypothetical protein
MENIKFNKGSQDLPENIEKLTIYKAHLKKMRTFWWVALTIFSLLFYWYGENDRYKYTGELVLDSKTGKIYHYSKLIKRDSKPFLF